MPFTLRQREFHSGKGGGWGWQIQFDSPPGTKNGADDGIETIFYVPTRTWLKKYCFESQFNKNIEVEFNVYLPPTPSINKIPSKCSTSC